MDYVHHQPGGGDKEVTMKSYLNYNCDLKIWIVIQNLCWFWSPVWSGPGGGNVPHWLWTVQNCLVGGLKRGGHLSKQHCLFAITQLEMACFVLLKKTPNVNFSNHKNQDSHFSIADCFVDLHCRFSWRGPSSCWICVSHIHFVFWYFHFNLQSLVPPRNRLVAAFHG